MASRYGPLRGAAGTDEQQRFATQGCAQHSRSPNPLGNRQTDNASTRSPRTSGNRTQANHRIAKRRSVPTRAGHAGSPTSRASVKIPARRPARRINASRTSTCTWTRSTADGRQCLDDPDMVTRGAHLAPSLKRLKKNVDATHHVQTPVDYRPGTPRRPARSSSRRSARNPHDPQSPGQSGGRWPTRPPAGGRTPSIRPALQSSGARL